MSDEDILKVVPTTAELREEIGRLLRRLSVARQMLRLAEKAERYKKLEKAGGEEK
jgi:hypothetical protein